MLSQCPSSTGYTQVAVKIVYTGMVKKYNYLFWRHVQKVLFFSKLSTPERVEPNLLFEPVRTTVDTPGPEPLMVLARTVMLYSVYFFNSIRTSDVASVMPSFLESFIEAMKYVYA